jgi:hypothetical protein
MPHMEVGLLLAVAYIVTCAAFCSPLPLARHIRAPRRTSSMGDAFSLSTMLSASVAVKRACRDGADWVCATGEHCSAGAQSSTQKCLRRRCRLSVCFHHRHAGAVQGRPFSLQSCSSPRLSRDRVDLAGLQKWRIIPSTVCYAKAKLR